MRVFVTGASGFIGSHLVSVLIQAGCEVAILVEPESSIWRLQKDASRLNIIQGDLFHLDQVAPQLAKFQPQACFHLAWYVEPGKYLTSDKNISYLVNSISLLKLFIEIGCKQVVMAGTCAEYDTDIGGCFNETSPTKPSTIYAASKLCLSILGQQIARDANIRFAWVRLFYLYGKTEDKRRIVPAVINALLRNEAFLATAGEQVRDYLHVEDVASALWFIAQNQLTGVFNISSGEPITIRNLMELIGNILNKRELIQFGAIPYQDWEPMYICGDNHKLRSLGWQPNIQISEGLKDAITWWQNQ